MVLTIIYDVDHAFLPLKVDEFFLFEITGVFQSFYKERKILSFKV